MVPTVAWEDDAVVMIDQRRLPAEEVYLRCRRPPRGRGGHPDMAIRGAPAIGVAAAFGLALGVRTSRRPRARPCGAEFEAICAELRGHAADRGQPVLGDRADAPPLRRAAAPRRRRALRAGARSTRPWPSRRRTSAACRRMGDLGAELLPARRPHPDPLQRRARWPPPATARPSASIRSAARAGQAAARLRRRDAPATSRARASPPGSCMQRRHPHDPDRRQHGRPPDGARARWTRWSWAPTASPPTATWRTRSAPTRVAVLATENGIPFYVAAPVSTFDLATPRRRARSRSRSARRRRSRTMAGRRLAPEGVAVRNPAFDVTPAPLRHRDRLRARRRPAALRARACARWSRRGLQRHAPPRHRDLVRRDGGRGRRGRPAHPLERRLDPGRDPRALRRRRARSWPRATTSRTSCPVIAQAMADARDRASPSSTRWR